jgi:monofunctional biosynthetic peptidoglycan transglycosylase
VRRLLLIGLGAVAVGGLLFYSSLPDVAPLATSFPKSTAFMERRRAELAGAGESTHLEWTPVPLSRISPNLRRAVVAAEDARFYEHGGVDWEAVRGALEKDFKKRRLQAGASTITQQLAKNLFLSPERTPWRKLREWSIARRLESNLPKQRILELYLNVVEFGRRTYGAEAAARHYFAKSAADLTPIEAATLAAVIPSPRIYDPVRHPSRVARRARHILRWMRVVERVEARADSPVSSPQTSPAGAVSPMPDLTPLPRAEPSPIPGASS